MRGTGTASEFASTKLGRRMLLILSMTTFCLVLFVMTQLQDKGVTDSENEALGVSISGGGGFIVTRSLTIDAKKVLTPEPVQYIESAETKSLPSPLPQPEIRLNSRDVNTNSMDASYLFNNQMIKANDRLLIKYLLHHNLFSPPNPKRILPNIEPSEWAVQLEAIFKGKKNGFFIECGANDGEFLSNSYKMEVAHGWNGILIEANPFIFPKLLRRQRNAWISDACLAIVPYPQKVEYIHRLGAEQWKSGNGIIKPSSGGVNNSLRRRFQPAMSEYIDAGFRYCYPLYTFLLAVNVTTVDYFSLDVEGYEYQILNTIPFDKVTIKVISAEYNIIPEGKQALIKLLREKGYEVFFETFRELFFILSKFKSELMGNVN